MKRAYLRLCLEELRKKNSGSKGLILITETSKISSITGNNVINFHFQDSAYFDALNF